ncbi:MAG: hypothetical protein ACRC4W_09105 [Treponemataceae bacterium]
MKIKWYEQKEGVQSSLRIALLITVGIGCLTVLCGVVAMFMENPLSVPAMGVGAGMTAIGEAAKAYQSKYEEE